MFKEDNIKRAELHLYTKSSKLVRSTIDILSVIKKADELGLSAIAFADYKSINGILKIIKIYNKNNFGVKIICGVELPFETTTQIYKTKGYSLTILAKNQSGFDTLQELTSTLKPDERYNPCELLNMELLMKNRKNLLIGSTSQHGEIYYELKWWWDGIKDYKKMADFYDFIEISPTKDEEEKSINKRIVELGKVFKIPVIATCHATSITIDEAKIRNDSYILSTEEMLKEFSYLGEKTAIDLVINNPKTIADLIENF